MATSESFLVVGGNSGIGRAIVNILSHHNKRIVVCDKEISDDLAKKCSCYMVDLRERERVCQFVNEVVIPMEVTNLVYSAGYQENLDVFESDIQNWYEMFQVHVFSAFMISQAVAKTIEKKQSGTLAYISSIHGNIVRSIPHYSASKAAQNMMMKEFALKIAPAGGRAFSIAPGSIDTPMLRKDLSTDELMLEGAANVPMKRHGTATEIASLYYHLLTDGYLTGTIVVADGGLSLVI